MTQRSVVITGGSGGLGLVVSRVFLDAGDALVIPVQDDTQHARLAQGLGTDLARVKAPTVDLTREASVEEMFAALPPIDAIVHLVGGFAMGPLVKAELATLQQQLELNVVTTFLVLKHGLAKLKATGRGRIVTVASKAALDPPAELGLYAAAKAAVLALTRAAAAETKGTDITANCVLPTVIDTPANRSAMGDEQAKTWVRPKRLAETIRYLCSDAAGDLRGSPLYTFGSV